MVGLMGHILVWGVFGYTYVQPQQEVKVMKNEVLCQQSLHSSSRFWGIRKE